LDHAPLSPTYELRNKKKVESSSSSNNNNNNNTYTAQNVKTNVPESALQEGNMQERK